MHIRRPAFAGSFYPESASELKGFMERIPEYPKIKCIGAVVPHAGYVFSGGVAASVYGRIEKSFDTVVILGPNHSGSGDIAAAVGIWQTPFGSVKIDEEFVAALKIAVDNGVHSMEHSIEVQIPFLQFFFPDVRIVPISISPSFFDVKTCKQIGEAIAESASELGKKILVVASSDFTHYGSVYGYKPFSGSVSQVLKKIKELDFEAVKAVTDFAPERLLELSRARTICGYGCISAMLYYAKKAGAKNAELIDYCTSFDVSKNSDAIVSYCGILVS